MRTTSLFLFLLAMPCCAAELAHWRAGEPSVGVSVTPASGAVEPSHDYYQRATLKVKLAQSTPAAAWLTITYPDKGYGLISINAKVRQQDEWGVARLNTGATRRAVFLLPAGTKEVAVAGLPRMTELRLNTVKPAYEAAPLVEPAFKLKRPMNLVISSGADANTMEELPDALAMMRNLAPLARALGFNGIESYVKWNFVEPAPGKFDWSFYDAIVAECQRHGLKWFPLLIVGSAYALPDWFYNTPEHVRYKCLEHGLETDIPTIFNDGQVKYVRRFLTEFGKHYGANPALLGVRLGPSANYGEAQYPASGAWGYRGKTLHTHLGYWVGDDGAAAAFRAWLRTRYAGIGELNKAWGGATYASFDAVKPFLPVSALNARMRKDFTTWYMEAMTNWCGQWAKWAREAMPNVDIYQSSGGWGAVVIGTDYIAHTKSMAALHGGIRLTNENDSYVNNFCVTRPAASAARFYGAKFGTEPAGFGTRRGVINRLFNIVANNGQHLFYYFGNLYDNDQAIDGWLKYARLLDQREQPLTEVAAFYPDTANKLDDGVMSHLYGSTFFAPAYALRSLMDYDFAGEQMILDGALEHYKVLVFLAGRVTEKNVLAKIDAWVRAGGTVIYPLREGSRQVPFTTVEGDRAVFDRWLAGDTGKGRALVYTWHPERKLYLEYIKKQLLAMPALRPELKRALAMEKPEETYWSVTASGKLVLLNYGDDTATVRLPGSKALTVAPYSIVIE